MRHTTMGCCNKKGIDAPGMLGTIIVVLLILAVVFYFSTKIYGMGRSAVAVGTCTVFGDTAAEGRCFATENCDGKTSQGWTSIKTKIGCTKDKAKPYCCYLEDEDLYYPGNTLLLKSYADPDATFRLVQDQTLGPQLEYGDDGASKYAKNGVPRNAPFLFQFKPEKPTSPGDAQSELYCKIEVGAYQLKEGVDQKRVVNCVPGEFTPLTDPITYQVVKQDAHCGTTYCVVPVRVFTGETPESVRTLVGTFYIPFQK